MPSGAGNQEGFGQMVKGMGSSWTVPKTTVLNLTLLPQRSLLSLSLSLPATAGKVKCFDINIGILIETWCRRWLVQRTNWRIHLLEGHKRRGMLSSLWEFHHQAWASSAYWQSPSGISEYFVILLYALTWNQHIANISTSSVSLKTA